jgi:hypothetical protein
MRSVLVVIIGVSAVIMSVAEAFLSSVSVGPGK